MKKTVSIMSYAACAVLSLGILTACAYARPIQALENERTSGVTKNIPVENENKGPSEAAQKGQERAAQVRQNTNKDDTATGRELAAEKKAANVARLADKKLELCQNKQETITSSLRRAADQGLNQIDVFKKIADRTMTFYEEQGNAVANYDQLVAEVNNKYKVAKLTVATITADMVFDCTSNNPKAALMAFRDTHKQNTAALKAYKTAIKNLIVAVKSAQLEANQPGVEAR